MISNQLTTLKAFSNNDLIRLDGGKFQTDKFSNCSFNKTQRFPTDSTFHGNHKSIIRKNDDVRQINPDPSPLVSWELFSQSKVTKHQSNRDLTLIKQNLSEQIHLTNSSSDCIDWTTHPLNISSMDTTTINDQLNAINCLQNYLEQGNSDALVDLLHVLAYEINQEPRQNRYAYAAMNNNHIYSTPMFNTSLQLSNNKDKKNKKEKSVEKEKKDDKKKEHDNETNHKKSKKQKDKTKSIEETTTTDSETAVNSPVVNNLPRVNFSIPKSPPYSPIETIGFQSLSVPLPAVNGFMPTTPSHVHTPLQSNMAHPSQQNPFINKTTPSHKINVQQQLQSLSQMARDGEEILITLSINTLNQKQQIHGNNNQQHQTSPQNNPYPSAISNQMISQSTGMMMPHNLEIVAKGYVRVQNDHSQQPMMPSSYNQPPFLPRYPTPCYSSNGPPQVPIAPPIQPIFPPTNMMMSNGFLRPPTSTTCTTSLHNNFDAPHSSHINHNKCDYLCQLSLNQPDFRGRPSPGVFANPYFSNPPPTSINFSAKQSSKHFSSNDSNHINSENINRTFSSIY